MAGVNAAQLVTPGADPITALLAELMKPARQETTTSAGGGTTTAVNTASTANVTALQQLVTQLQSQATPAGSAALIQEIFKTGMQTNMPGINAATSGARAGSSTYRALAVNDLTARLAGQASAEVNRSTQAATQAAAALAQATQGTTQTQTQTVAPKTQTTTQESKFNLQDLLLPIGVSAGKSALKSILEGGGKKAATSAVAAAFAPEAIGVGNAFANEFAAAPAAFDFSTLPGVAATAQSGSMTDFITSGGNYTSYVAPTAEASIAADSSNFFDFSGNSSSGGGGGATNAAVTLALNEFFGGGNNADTMGNAAVYATPYLGPVAAAANMLGVNEVQGPVSEIAGVYSDVIQGAGDAVGETFNAVTGGTVICTELNRRGILAGGLYRAYADKIGRINPITMRGYQLWAIPVVRAMRKEKWYSKLLVKLATPFAIGRAHRIIGFHSFAGAVTVYIGEPVCYVLGLFCCHNKPLVTEV